MALCDLRTSPRRFNRGVEKSESLLSVYSKGFDSVEFHDFKTFLLIPTEITDVKMTIVPFCFFDEIQKNKVTHAANHRNLL